ncbi:MAG: MaoC family dehydratase [Gammaproteobacteria bacterium]|nr:MaoC family dehydratase [Gammaproteobacteria bacterium]MBQ0840420.1 MaoC family dehydratase [Gammaproteobacteria bacterium]
MKEVFFDQIATGEQLPSLTKPPITRTTLAYFCGASNDHNPVHIDSDFARAAGADDVFVHGMLDMAYMGQLLTGWVPQSAILSFGVKFGAIVYVGDTITCHGEVVDKTEQGGVYSFKLKLRAVDQNGESKLTGEAQVRVSPPRVSAGRTLNNQ